MIIHVVRKPSDFSFVRNVLAFHTGALHLNKLRVGSFIPTTPAGFDRFNGSLQKAGYRPGSYSQGVPAVPTTVGRFPANLLLTRPVADQLDRDVGPTRSGKMKQMVSGNRWNTFGQQYDRFLETIGDTGNPSRFFQVIP